MPLHRRRIPSFSLSDATSGPPAALNNTLVANSTGEPMPNDDVDPMLRTPTRRDASKPLPLNEAATPSSAGLTVAYDDGEDNITPTAYTFHVPLGGRPSPASEVAPPQGSLLLTSRIQPKLTDEGGRRRSLAVSEKKARHASMSSTTGQAGHELQPPPDEYADWCLAWPQASKSAVSLPPSARFSTTSRSPSKHWVKDLDSGNYSSPAFPPTMSTNLVLIPKDRDVEFHVNASTVFYESPVLGKLIRPHLSFPLESNKFEPEVDVYIVEETYEALDAILRFMHTKVAKPTVRSITHLARLLAACKRYEIMAGLQTLSVLLIQFAGMSASPSNTDTLVGSPLECYGLACKFGFSNIAKLISTRCLAVDPLKADLGTSMVGVAAKDVRRLFELHHSRGLAALALVDAAVDANEFWCEGCSGLAGWFDKWREAAEYELKSKPITRTVFCPSFIAGCLKQAIKKCPHHCMEHYLAPKTQLRFAILQKDIDGLRDRI